MTWAEILIETLQNLKGKAHLSDIYTYVYKNYNFKCTKHYEASIRNALEKYSSDSDAFNGDNCKDYFYIVGKKGEGVWGLRNYTNSFNKLDNEEIITVSEGMKKIKQHKYIERNTKIIKYKKDIVLRETGSLKCEVCGFDFYDVYGELGKGYIEGHHKIPLYQIKSETTTTIDDIALVCSNCHRMLHRNDNEILSIEELSKIVKEIKLLNNKIEE